MALKRVGFGAVLLAAVVAVTACGTTTSATTGGSGNEPSEITIAAVSPPLSLDPAKNSNTAESQEYMDLAYEPLIKLEPDGSLGPGLASSWKYLDNSQTTFQLNLRSNAKFSDGSPVTAKQVVASLNHEKSAGGPVAVYVNTIKSATATGPHMVELKLIRPNPTIAFILTQRFLIGDIVGPKGTKNPESLGTTTDGAGPYMLDPSQTVAGDHYTFVPNPHYFEPKAVHFKKFTVRVIENPQATLSALQSGQVAFAKGSPQLAEAAKSRDLNVTSALSSWYGAFILDRDGEVDPALASPLVRQALNYATDRKGITQTIFGSSEFGKPTSEPTVAGYENEGYVPELEDHYPYDPSKAKELLAKAGYGNGFTVTIGASEAFGEGVQVAQALASDWGKVGVKVDIKQYPSIEAILPPWSEKKLPIVIGGYDAQPMYIFSEQALAPTAGLFNIWEASEPKLTSLIEKGYAATRPAQQGAAWAAVTKQVVELGWFVPYAAGATVYFSVSGLEGVEISPVAFGQNPNLLHY
ncbi:MAG TPA: ABC transporter substrate-binding protein [Solirubrobacterales bacterium]